MLPLNLSSYISLSYLMVFLPAVIAIYHFMNQKYRWVVLLLASYAFFWTISGGLIVYLLGTTLSIFALGLQIEKLHEKRKAVVKESEKSERKAIKAKYQKKLRRILLLGVLINIGALLVLKYTGFFGENLNRFFARSNPDFWIDFPRFILPIGISFYTMQAVSYLFDVYRETIPAEHDLGRMALFMSFFPQLVEGPICRYSDTAHALKEGRPITYDNLASGGQRILYGVMKKMLVADRLNVFIKTVFVNYQEHDGGMLFVAGLCYTIQLYMDFSGTMDVVIGTGEIFGVKLPENFRQPFFARSVSEFWQRWHITLGTWFKDYLFFPLSMSKPLKRLTSFGRKHLGNHYGPLLAGAIALFAVWFSNGLWHGAAWTFLAFGMYHFAMILIGNLVRPLSQWFFQKTGISTDNPVVKVLQILRTGLFVVFGEIIFRADGLRAMLGILKGIFTNFTLDKVMDGYMFILGIDPADFVVVAITLAIVFAVSLYNEKGKSVRRLLATQKTPVRWAVLYGLILFIVVFGAYGYGYIPVDPMYANF